MARWVVWQTCRGACGPAPANRGGPRSGDLVADAEGQPADGVAGAGEGIRPGPRMPDDDHRLRALARRQRPERMKRPKTWLGRTAVLTVAARDAVELASRQLDDARR